MTAERSSEDNDGHQIRATIGLAGGCAVQRRSVRHHEPVSGKLGSARSSRSPIALPALRPASFAPGFRGLSEGLIDSKPWQPAAAGSRYRRCAEA